MGPVSKKGKFYVHHVSDGSLSKGGGSLRKASGSLGEKILHDKSWEWERLKIKKTMKNCQSLFNH